MLVILTIHFTFAPIPSPMNGFNSFARLALFNLLTVAFLGFVLRLKVVVAMPWINQKYLLHGHSHFAFIAWASLIGMLFVIRQVCGPANWPRPLVRYLYIYVLNAWLMLAGFFMAGYGPLSMAFLSIHIGLTIWFARWWLSNRHIKDHPIAALAITTGQVYNILSFAGPVLLGYFMASGTGSMYAKQNAIYMFLHYQYNGFFLFTCIGILLFSFRNGTMPGGMLTGIRLLSLGVFAGLGLLMLMPEKPVWLTTLNYSIAACLFVSVILIVPGLVSVIRNNKPDYSWQVKLLLGFSLAGFIFKIVLQGLSAWPTIGYMVYEHRAIAIGYLHLIFLVVISFFYLAFLLNKRKVTITGYAGLYIFVLAVIVNEIVLGLQGLGAIIHVLVPHTNTILTVVTGLMFTGVLLIYTGVSFKEERVLKS